MTVATVFICLIIRYWIFLINSTSPTPPAIALLAVINSSSIQRRPLLSSLSLSPSNLHPSIKGGEEKMESMKMSLVAALVVMQLIAVLSVQNAAASSIEAPAPAPASDAAVAIVPAVFASIAALAVGMLF
ncbi:hypothetical protein Dimus_001805 [Dionaea muscipula]